MKFQQDSLIEFKENDFVFVQKFAEYTYQLQRLDKKDLEIIIANKDYTIETLKDRPTKKFSWT